MAAEAMLAVKTAPTMTPAMNTAPTIIVIVMGVTSGALCTRRRGDYTGPAETARAAAARGRFPLDPNGAFAPVFKLAQPTGIW
jgi:hypothetical protein